jgi:uncharacterized RDD family membrane protein YckC
MEGTPPPRRLRESRSLPARLLGLGARGAQRAAEVTGIDEAVETTAEGALVAALESEAVERAIVRVLEGPAVEEAVQRALASPAVERTVVEVLDSEMVDRVWERLLASDEAQKLVERIAEAPEVRAAVTQQGVGLLEDIGRQVRRIADRLDDALEGLARRLTGRHRREEAPEAERRVGLVTRGLAAAIDGGILNGAYLLASAVIGITISDVVGGDGLTITSAAVAGALWVIASMLYLDFFWALAGQTPGMRFLGIRIEHDGDPHLGQRIARRRLGWTLISIAALGLGLLRVLVSDDRRGWPDMRTETEVVRVDPGPAPWSADDRNERGATGSA